MARLAGRYELQERLAEGGMAEVWLATAHGDAGFTRRVAIKQLFARQHDASFERMFLDEARLTSRLHHAAIVSILDFGVEAGRPFQVLELVDGHDAWRLSQWALAQGTPLPLGLALHICAVVGHALHFAHSTRDDAGAPLNIVHRDVSPQNVLLSRAGDVKLSDFGIAFAEGRLEKTVGGIARGKPAYMAPEQAVRGAMDGRTDVFALGCVLHALVTGESALRDENALVDLLAGVELRLNPALPEPVRAIVARATRRDKAERFENAEAMALACAALVPTLLEGEPRTALAAWVRGVTPERPALAPTPVLATPPAPRWRAPTLGGLALGLATVAGWSLWPRDPPPAEAPTPVALRAEAAPTPAAPPPEPTPSAALPSPAPPAPVTATREPGAAPTQPPRGTDTAARAKPVAEVRRGVLAIGGERFLRGEVHIDGVPRGTAPAHIELPVGPHVVEVVLASGERVGPRTLTVSPQHTELAPLYWLE